MSIYRYAAALVSVGVAVATFAASPSTIIHVPKTSSHSTAVATQPLQVLTIGDSIMNGYGLADGQSWPTLVAANNGWTLTNDACDGAGVIAIGSAHECDSNFSGVIDSVSTLHPDIVIFEGSSNDFGEDNSALLASTIAELQALRVEFPNAQIVGLSTLWGSTDPPDQLAQVDAQVQQAVQAVGGTYLDIGQPMLGHPELMQDDDIHPTAAGQAAIATDIQAALQGVVTNAIQSDRLAATKVAHVQVLVHLGLLQ